MTFTFTFSSGPVVKNPLCNAGRLDSIRSGGTKIPHALEQLGQDAATIETSRQN